MSTRMDYARSLEFGATRASIKAGERYEEKVNEALGDFLRSASPSAYSSLLFQVPRYGGLCDAAFTHGHKFLIEVKSQWSLAAYKQLLHYGGKELPLVSRVCICKVYHPHVPIPEPVECLPLAQLLRAEKGKMTVIPWSGRGQCR